MVNTCGIVLFYRKVSKTQRNVKDALSMGAEPCHWLQNFAVVKEFKDQTPQHTPTLKGATRSALS